MEIKENGYKVKEYHQPVKRYCQTLDLKNDPVLIAEYVTRHANIWPEIKAGICEVGILEMQIFLLGTRLFMIVETPLDFDWNSAMAKLATLPRQAEWEEYMSMFQISSPDASSSEKWKLMDEIFHL